MFVLCVSCLFVVCSVCCACGYVLCCFVYGLCVLCACAVCRGVVFVCATRIFNNNISGNSLKVSRNCKVYQELLKFLVLFLCM